MTGEQYWKIRALSMGVQLERERAEAAVMAAQRRLDAAMRAAGLDPGQPYRFSDEAQQIVAADLPMVPDVA
jgi:hypothetical protein